MVGFKHALLVMFIIIAIILVLVPAFSQAGNAIPEYVLANVTITNVSVSRTVSVNSPVAISIMLNNSGAMATGNIILNAKISSRSGVLSVTYNAPPLLPQQNESIILLIYNKTMRAGVHNVTVDASYMSLGEMSYTRQKSTSYVVAYTPDSQNYNSTIITRAPGFILSYFPLYSSLLEGSAIVSQIGIRNPTSFSEFVNLSVSENYSKFIALSTDSMYLYPGSTMYAKVLLKAPSENTEISTFYIPIRLILSPVNGVSNTITEHVALSILNESPNKPSLLNEVALDNSTNSITGVMEIRSGTDRPISNTTLVTYLPYNTSSTSFKVSAYGLQANVSNLTGAYIVRWYIPYLPAGQVTYGYYHINASGGSEFPMSAYNILSTLSMTKPTDVLKIMNLSLPPFYLHSSEKISVDVLYTGTSAQYVYFYLTAPPDATVYNATQTVLATPNQLMSRSFRVETSGTPGTKIFTLYVNTQGANITYTLPIIVLQEPENVTLPQVSNGTSLSAIQSNYSGSRKSYIIAAFGVFVLVLLIFIVKVMTNKSKYNAYRAQKLKSIKEQIDR